MKIAYLTNGVILKTPRQCQMKKEIHKHLYKGIRVYYRRSPSYYYDMKRHYERLHDEHYEGEEKE